MIRRGDLDPATRRPETVTHAVLSVRRGESVRIVGLGTLARVAAPVGAAYRLTLTAAVARTSRNTWRNASETTVHLCNADLERDAHHLARALGAPVEVWAPPVSPSRRTGARGIHARLLTTVHP